MTKKPNLVLGSLVGLMLSSTATFAAVSPQEAAALKTSLTPFGAEKAGNADGSIPAWTGGLTAPPPGVTYDPASKHVPNWYGSDKVVLAITKDNVDQYADKLSEGIQYLVRNYDGYKVEVYPTHRPEGAPQWVYDATFANATTATLTEPDDLTQGLGGLPFPIPKTGAQIMKNATNPWSGSTDNHAINSVWYVSSDGTRTVASATNAFFTYPQYYQPGREQLYGGKYALVGRVTVRAPAYLAGLQQTEIHPINYTTTPPLAWVYLAGQRRVRKLPNALYDTPLTFDSGLTNEDDSFGFQGPLDRYTWKIIGKKEIYVPYDDEAATLEPDSTKVIGPKFFNPDYTRFEKHRVWVVEGDLAPGKRHTVPKRVLYIDEDSWIPLLVDEWDAQGKLWKITLNMPQTNLVGPGIYGSFALTYDIQANNYAVFAITNGADEGYTYSNAPLASPSYFTPTAMAAEGVD